MKILYTWIGDRELLEAGKKYPDFMPLALKHIENYGPWQNNLMEIPNGDVRRAIDKYTPDKIIVLDDYPDRESLEQNKHFREEYQKTFAIYKVDIQIEPVVLPDKDDYEKLYLKMKEILEKTSQSNKEVELYFLLESGTYAMTLCWLLIGTALHGKASHFLRNNQQGELTEFKIPLELSFDFIQNQDNYIKRISEDFNGLIGNSESINKAIKDAMRAAPHDVTVLLVGETGTGKEKFAEAIKNASLRKDKPYEVINCAAIPANLLEDTLFGHIKGAFTGAVSDEPGILDKVDGGTLFLDEVGECPPEMQAKLLRVLQPPSNQSLTYREYYPVGSRTLRHSDVRIIAATNRDLRAMSQKMKGEPGSFRSDLLYRLSTIVIHLLPLRQRRDDIMLIANELLKAFKNISSIDIDKHFSEETKKLLQEYDWPGNVRELSNAILRSIIMSEKNIIHPEDLGIDFPGKQMNNDSSHEMDESSGIDLNEHLRRETQKWLKIAMDNTDSKKAAAEWLGLKSPQALDSKLRSVGMEYSKRERQ